MSQWNSYWTKGNLVHQRRDVERASTWVQRSEMLLVTRFFSLPCISNEQNENWCFMVGNLLTVTTCDTPNVANAMWMWKNTPYHYRDVVSFECVRGYVMYGASTVVCGANGQWFPRLPACRGKSWTYHACDLLFSYTMVKTWLKNQLLIGLSTSSLFSTWPQRMVLKHN